MVKVYYFLVKHGYRTIDKVPEAFRAEVQKLIDEGATE